MGWPRFDGFNVLKNQVLNVENQRFGSQFVDGFHGRHPEKKRHIGRARIVNDAVCHFKRTEATQGAF